MEHSIGFSQNIQDNSAGQLNTEQHQGSYASVNLLYRPMQNVLVGVEGLWGERVNKNGAKGTDQRVQARSFVGHEAVRISRSPPAHRLT
jgi:hypothetical protein